MSQIACSTTTFPAGAFPAAADAALAARFCAELAQQGGAAARLAARPDLRRVLEALGGNSPYLAESALREPELLARLAEIGPDAALAELLAVLDATPPGQPRARIAALLRHTKRRAALLIAIAEIGGLWTLEQVTAQLSALADTALRLGVRHLLAHAHAAGALRLPHPEDPARDSGFVVLGMGKLGAHELNYSSDIDLILLFDPASHPAASEELGAVFVRLARDLVALMATRDADGYVFRTDLRLRPDPAATPLAVSLPAALSYYESMGQSWERAAMIKARPVAGDLALGGQFLAAIRPFIWRRHLDFAALADIQAMKRRIDAHRGGALPDAATLAGFDIKLGQGGIREVEFVAQALQMVWGGRDPGLRSATTLGALAALQAAGRLPAAAVAALDLAYQFLRSVEHRLQMIDDRQTHSLPTRPEDFTRVAIFAGFAETAGFVAALLGHLARVHARFTALFDSTPASVADGAVGQVPEPATPRLVPPSLAPPDLAQLGFRNLAGIGAVLRGWQAGHIRALRSDRAQEVMRELLPHLLAELARQPEPDAAFARFDAFLSRQPAGIQLLSLLRHNPALLDRIIGLLGAAPLLAEHLARFPAALEGLLAAEAPDPAPGITLARQLRDATTLEDALSVIRRFIGGEQFRLSVSTLEGRLDIDRAGRARTDLADATLRALLVRVLDDFAARHGVVRGGAMVVVALGKAGSREMLAGSDLDLMLIYDHPQEVTTSQTAAEGEQRALPASQYYLRAAHALVAALTAAGAEGPLFPVDMRLRPSGNKGPVAVSLRSFMAYHETEAWTWERMALTRARVVAGPAGLRRRVAHAIAMALRCAPERGRLLRQDAAAMRARLARELPGAGPWDVKLRAGGLMEVEFIAQVLQLQALQRHALQQGALATPAAFRASPTTRLALRRLARAGLLTYAEAALLVRADFLWRSVQNILRLSAAPSDTLPPGALAALCRLSGSDAPDAMQDSIAAQVRRIFLARIGDAAGALAPIGHPAPAA